VDEEPEPLHLQAQDDSGINFLTMSAVLTFHAAHCLALPQTLAIVCSSPKDWRAASCVASTPGIPAGRRYSSPRSVRCSRSGRESGLHRREQANRTNLDGGLPRAQWLRLTADEDMKVDWMLRLSSGLSVYALAKLIHDNSSHSEFHQNLE
jgi:hypothetical protein